MTEAKNDMTAHWQDKTNEKIHDPIKAAHMAVVQDKWRDFAKHTSEVAEQQAESADVSDAHFSASMENSRKAVDAVTKDGPNAVESAGVLYDNREYPVISTMLESVNFPPEVPSVDPRAENK